MSAPAPPIPEPTRPIILSVDDEPHVLNAIARDLQARYQDDYRVVKAASGAEALEAAREFKRRNLPVALFVVDQRMPEMTGTALLGELLQLYPDAKKVLLTAYADTDAAIASINTLDLDYYLMKPWDPPEERLYPVIDDLLSDWLAAAPAPADGIRVVGTQWSAGSYRVKDFLARAQIPYQWLDLERSAEAKALVDSTSESHPPLPVVFFPDGATLFDPDLRTLADKVGLATEAQAPFYELVIIGAGPAGLAAAVYGASEGLRTVVVEMGAPGGQAGTSARIENYLGFPQGVSGADLTRRATTQAQRLGAELLTARRATGIRVEGPYRIVTLDDGTELRCKALLVATGVKVRELEAPGVDSLTGASVYYGTAASEGHAYEMKKVFVVGGANSAGQGAVFLSRFADVTMLIRGDSLKKTMSSYLIDQIERTPSITVLPHSEVAAVHGTDRLESIEIRNNQTGETETRQGAALFIFIGAAPNTDMVQGVVALDDQGFILTGPDLMQDGRRPKNWRPKRDPFPFETSVPGIFAAGDVQHGVVRRVASAVGQGAVAVSMIHKYLETV